MGDVPETGMEPDSEPQNPVNSSLSPPAALICENMDKGGAYQRDTPYQLVVPSVGKHPVDFNRTDIERIDGIGLSAGRKSSFLPCGSNSRILCLDVLTPLSVGFSVVFRNKVRSFLR